jgi:hypothetical protein
LRLDTLTGKECPDLLEDVRDHDPILDQIKPLVLSAPPVLDALIAGHALTLHLLAPQEVKSGIGTHLLPGRFWITTARGGRIYLSQAIQEELAPLIAQQPLCALRLGTQPLSQRALCCETIQVHSAHETTQLLL